MRSIAKPKGKGKKFTFKANVKKRKWQRIKKKQRLEDSTLKQHWDSNTTVQRNMDNLGLVYDLNKAGSSKKQSTETEGVEIAVIADLTKQADELAAAPRVLRLSQPEIRFCVHMIEKYAADFDGMARDMMNHYQFTPTQIRRKIELFKKNPGQYNGYLRAKGIKVERAETNALTEKMDATTIEHVDE